MIIDGCSFRLLLLLSSFRARLFLARVNAVHILTGREVLFLLNWRLSGLSLRRHTPNDFFFFRQVFPQPSFLLLCLRTALSTPFQFGSCVLPAFVPPVA